MTMSKIYLLLGIVVVLGLGGVFLSGGGTDTLTALATLKKPDPFSATAISASQISLNWVDTNSSEDGYQIYRRKEGVSSFSLIVTAPQNSTNYQDQQGLSTSTKYYYKARAVRGGSNSTYSVVANATTLASNPISTPIPTSTSTPEDTIAPTLSINSPAQGSSFYAGQTVIISASSTDNVQVSRVVFSGGTTFVPETTDTTLPYSLSVPVTSVSALGQHCFSVFAYDTSENRTTGGPRCFNVVAIPTPSPNLTAIAPTLFGHIFPYSPKSGDSTSLGSQINNITNSFATSTQARLRIDVNYGGTSSWDILPANKTVPALSAYATTSVLWSNVWIAVPGDHRVEVCADILNNVSETNESDNCFTYALHVDSPIPNLIATFPTSFGYIIPLSPKSGDSMSLGSQVQNITSVYATSSQARIRIDVNRDTSPGWDVFPANRLVPALSAYATTTVMWSNVWIAVPGNHNVEICADILNNVSESNEGDNCFVYGFSVPTPLPDLKGIGHYLAPLPLTIGNPVVLGLKIQNAANAFATSSQARLRIDLNFDGYSTSTPTWDILPANRLTTPLGAYSSTTVIWPDNIMLPTGSHNVELCADATNIIAESIEGNNCYGFILSL